MSDPLNIVPITLQYRTGLYTGPEIDLGIRHVIQLRADVYEVSGGSFTLITEDSQDQVHWRIISSIPALGDGSRVNIVHLDTDRYLRCRTTSASGKSMYVYGTADEIYATQTDVNTYALQSAATVGVTVEQWARILVAASAEADSYLGTAYKLPISKWGSDLSMHVASLAAFYLISGRGFTPGGPDEILVKRRDDAVKWLKDVSLGRVSPASIVDSTPAAVEGAYAIYSDPVRGWGST